MTLPIFFYGTLRDEQLRQIVAGVELAGRMMRLGGFRVGTADIGRAFLVPDENGVAEGLLVEPEAGVRQRLDFLKEVSVSALRLSKPRARAG